MFNLLIVDDEIYAVEGLRLGVKWSSLGFSGVYEAYNIQSAKEIIREVQIHVVICDIEMPEGDGFELIAWIRENYPDIATLFLTCHADFKYAQRAIQLGTQDYLLKPVDYDTLQHVVGRIIVSIKEEREWKQTQQIAQAFWESKKNVLVERFWQDLLSARLSTTAERLEQTLHEFKVSFDPGQMNVLPILISIEQWTQVFTERDEELMEYAMRKVAEEMILDGFPGCTVQDRNGVNLVIVYCKMLQPVAIEVLLERCENFITYCERHFYCRASCYIGEKLPIEQTKQGYEHLLKMEYDNIARSHSVHLFISANEKFARLPSVNLSEWPALIEQDEGVILRQQIHKTLSRLKDEGGNAEALLIYYHNVLQCIYLVLQKQGKSIQEVFGEAGVLEPTSFPKTIDQMEEWAIKVTGMAIHAIKMNEDSIVRQVKEYIEAHLDERIERMELSELVHLNPAYLSRLFKKETQESLTEFILSRKMQLSKNLLRGSNKPISEIAQIAGFSNLSYFSKAFKKLFQVSPMAYRKHGNPNKPEKANI